MMLNNFWGKYNQRTDLNMSTSDVFDLLTNDNQSVISNWEYVEAFVVCFRWTNVVIIAYTMTYARLALYSYLKLEAQCAEPVILFWGNFIQNLPGAPYKISINLDKWFYTEDFLICQSQTRTAYGSHISNKISAKYRNVYRYSHTLFLWCSN
jgi:hypothetical protein